LHGCSPCQSYGPKVDPHRLFRFVTNNKQNLNKRQEKNSILV
jgi:hypothetical protein